VFETALSDTWYNVLCDGVIYAPSASSYIYACSKKQKGLPEKGLIMIGDKNDPDLVDEAENVSKFMPCPVEIITNMNELKKAAADSDIIYIASHGESPGTSPEVVENISARSSWKLHFDGSTISTGDFFSERIMFKRGSVIMLSACSIGRLATGPVHELEGLVLALFYAGASTVLAARWPILYSTAAKVFGNTMQYAYRNQVKISTALAVAIKCAGQDAEIMKLMSDIDSGTFFFGPFALFGCGD
jgi:hypothetical protein